MRISDWSSDVCSSDLTASPDALSISVEELALGVPLTVDLEPGQERLYRIEVPADSTLRFRVGSNDERSINEVFLRHDAVPTSAAYDATYTGPLAQELTAIVPDTATGVYYVLVRGYSGPAESAQVTRTPEQHGRTHLRTPVHNATLDRRL